jgi:hypothetical protein
MAITLIGSLGVNVDLHICQGTIKTFSFWDDAEKCSALEELSICDIRSTDAQEKESIEKKKCCTNEHVFSKASFESNQNASVTELSLYDVNSSILETNELVLSSSRDIEICYTDPPPLESRRSLVILHDQFLI